MSQRNVERLIGRLLTDDALREQFLESPERAIASFVAEGWELTALEDAALAGLDPRSLSALASRVDPRIRKVSLRATPSSEATNHEQSPHPARPRGYRPTRKEPS
jgi:hypothetical protein